MKPMSLYLNLALSQTILTVPTVCQKALCCCMKIWHSQFPTWTTEVQNQTTWESENSNPYIVWSCNTFVYIGIDRFQYGIFNSAELTWCQ
jgi:hypothetical protein